MEIAIDIGNSFVKVGFFEHEKIMNVYQIEKQNHAQFIELSKKHKAARGVVSSVAENPDNFLQKFPKTQFLKVNKATKAPVSIQYDTPETLGIDRIALASAATVMFPSSNVLVIDAGTCITYDFVNEKNTFIGGGISPGINMRLQAMHSFTKNLPKIELTEQIKLIGTSTEMCMQTGAIMGAAAEIDGIIDRYKAAYENLTVVLCGGDTKRLVSLVKNGIFARQNFLLEGLHAILKYNE